MVEVLSNPAPNERLQIVPSVTSNLGNVYYLLLNFAEYFIYQVQASQFRSLRNNNNEPGTPTQASLGFSNFKQQQKKNIISAISCLEFLTSTQCPVSLHLQARALLSLVYKNWVPDFSSQEQNLQKMTLLVPASRENTITRLMINLKLIDLYMESRKQEFGYSILSTLISESSGLIKTSRDKGSVDMTAYYNLELLQVYLYQGNYEAALKINEFLERVFSSKSNIFAISRENQCIFKYNILLTILFLYQGNSGSALKHAQAAKSVASVMVRKHRKVHSKVSAHVHESLNCKYCTEFSLSFNLDDSLSTPENKDNNTRNINLVGLPSLYMDILSSMLVATCMKNGSKFRVARSIIKQCKDKISNHSQKRLDMKYNILEVQLYILDFYACLHSEDLSVSQETLETMTNLASKGGLWGIFCDEIMLCHGMYLVKYSNSLKAIETLNAVFMRSLNNKKFEIWAISGLQMALLFLGDQNRNYELASDIIKSIFKKFSTQLSAKPSPTTISFLQLIKCINTREVVKAKALVLECLRFFVDSSNVPLQVISLSYAGGLFANTNVKESEKMSFTAVSLSDFTDDPLYKSVSTSSQLISQRILGET
ncbi:hypothetical protein BB560_002713 [Smittium megazygosporum]|uniref:Cohesin loading factor n=1 Tax=Smittium megazygosporum TaxID=133381 RepID=A0A2T9ZE00_9FUNG|nr:hypothetical protein BB560_002713 [Smittium megazygosporum]